MKQNVNKSQYQVPEYVGQHIVSEDKSGYLRVTSPNEVTKNTDLLSQQDIQGEIFDIDINISQKDLFIDKNKSHLSKNLNYQNNSNEKSQPYTGIQKSEKIIKQMSKKNLILNEQKQIEKQKVLNSVKNKYLILYRNQHKIVNQIIQNNFEKYVDFEGGEKEQQNNEQQNRDQSNKWKQFKEQIYKEDLNKFNQTLPKVYTEEEDNMKKQAIQKVLQQKIDEETYKNSDLKKIIDQRNQKFRELEEKTKSQKEENIQVLCYNCKMEITDQNQEEYQHQINDQSNQKSIKNLNKKQEAIEEYRKFKEKQIEVEKGQFKVPIEYQMKYINNIKSDSQNNKNSHLTQLKELMNDEGIKSKQIFKVLDLVTENKLHDEIRIAYLSESLRKVTENFQQETKTFYLRQESKMRQYANQLLTDIKEQIKDEFLFLFHELENFNQKEILLRKENDLLQKKVYQATLQLTEIKAWAKYDEKAHQEFTDDLQKHGITVEELQQMSDEMEFFKRTFSQKSFYQNLIKPTFIEKETLDMSKPFRLFNGQIAFGLSEKLNLLERETVKIYQKKLNTLDGIVAQLKHKSDDVPSSAQKMVSDDTQKLENEIQDILNKNKDFEEKLLNLQIESKQKIKELKDEKKQYVSDLQNRLDQFQDMYLKELLVKDSIIKNIEGMKIHYENLSKKLDIQLKIPRHHYEFLKNKGALNHFVKAQLTGQDEIAKWTLLRTGQSQIKQIQNVIEEEEKQKIRQENDEKKMKLYGMERLYREKQEIKNNQFGKTRFLKNYSLSQIQSHDNLKSGEEFQQQHSKIFNMGLQEILKKNMDINKIKQHTSRILDNLAKAGSNNFEPSNKKQSKINSHRIHIIKENLFDQTLKNISDLKQQITESQKPKILEKYQLKKEDSLEESVEHSDSQNMNSTRQIISQKQEDSLDKQKSFDMKENGQIFSKQIDNIINAANQEGQIQSIVIQKQENSSSHSLNTSSFSSKYNNLPEKKMGTQKSYKKKTKNRKMKKQVDMNKKVVRQIINLKTSENMPIRLSIQYSQYVSQTPSGSQKQSNSIEIQNFDINQIFIDQQFKDQIKDFQNLKTRKQEFDGINIIKKQHDFIAQQTRQLSNQSLNSPQKFTNYKYFPLSAQNSQQPQIKKKQKLSLIQSQFLEFQSKNGMHMDVQKFKNYIKNNNNKLNKFLKKDLFISNKQEEKKKNIQKSFEIKIDDQPEQVINNNKIENQIQKRIVELPLENYESVNDEIFQQSFQLQKKKIILQNKNHSTQLKNEIEENSQYQRNLSILKKQGSKQISGDSSSEDDYLNESPVIFTQKKQSIFSMQDQKKKSSSSKKNNYKSFKGYTQINSQNSSFKKKLMNEFVLSQKLDNLNSQISQMILNENEDIQKDVLSSRVVKTQQNKFRQNKNMNYIQSPIEIQSNINFSEQMLKIQHSKNQLTQSNFIKSNNQNRQLTNEFFGQSSQNFVNSTKNNFSSQMTKVDNNQRQNGQYELNQKNHFISKMMKNKNVQSVLGCLSNQEQIQNKKQANFMQFKNNFPIKKNSYQSSIQSPRNIQIIQGTKMNMIPYDQYNRKSKRDQTDDQNKKLKEIQKQRQLLILKKNSKLSQDGNNLKITEEDQRLDQSSLEHFNQDQYIENLQKMTSFKVRVKTSEETERAKINTFNKLNISMTGIQIPQNQQEKKNYQSTNMSSYRGMQIMSFQNQIDETSLMARKNMDAFKLIGIHNDFIRVKKEESNEKFEEKKEVELKNGQKVHHLLFDKELKAEDIKQNKQSLIADTNRNQTTINNFPPEDIGHNIIGNKQKRKKPNILPNKDLDITNEGPKNSEISLKLKIQEVNQDLNLNLLQVQTKQDTKRSIISKKQGKKIQRNQTSQVSLNNQIKLIDASNTQNSQRDISSAVNSAFSENKQRNSTNLQNKYFEINQPISETSQLSNQIKKLKTQVIQKKDLIEKVQQ